MAFKMARDGNRIEVSGRFNSSAVYLMLQHLNDGLERGYQDFVLDFSLCEAAFPDGLVPLSALADSWRSNGLDFDLLLPKTDGAAKLMVNCNCAHFICPSAYEYQQVLMPKHISIRRYETLKEQVAIVKEFTAVALKAMPLSRDILQGMDWSLNEIMDNVLVHAEAERGGFAEATTLEDRIAFTIADCGRGVLDSLREGYPALRNDTDALGEAVKAGVTRNPEEGQGNGLAGSLRIAALSGGSFMLASGQGILSAFQEAASVASRAKVVPWTQRFPGTIVSMQILRDASFTISKALDFPNMVGGVYDVVESAYETEDGRAFIIHMKDEAPGFGNREAGKQIRTALHNLLKSDTSKALVVDWEGIPLISSSFADEAIGKLFVELGPLEFGVRVRNIKMESLIRGLIDKAIMQRTAQAINQATRATPAITPSTVEEAPPD
jgi:anti-sigma regulatory factor (Ser/Thr protein kinase)